MDENGFSLIEVLAALIILSLVVLGLVSSAGMLSHTVDTNERHTAAIQLAEDRVAQVQMERFYDSLETRYEVQETGFPSLPNFTRTTDITRIGGSGQPTDHKVITVTVDGPGVSAPVSRSVVVAAP